MNGVNAAVSVVVPIYHGKQYIKQMIRQVEVCSEVIDSEVELLFVNDDPEAPIKTGLYSEKIAVRVLNTDCNCGIHGARVKGLKASLGEYILFLDQDDRIFPSYLKSQISRIGDADAVVCRLIDGNKIYYNEQRPFEKAIDKNYVIGTGNIIVSPGQVLLRKRSVSHVWQRHILHNNGADDWLLWICMLSEGKQFLLNEDILFEHVVGRSNASLQAVKMMESEREVVEIVKKSELLSDDEIQILQQALWKEVYEKMRLLDKFRKMVTLYDDWLRLGNKGMQISNVLENRGYHICAIYGNGIIGKQIYETLKETGIRVCCFIDRSKPYLEEIIPVYRPDDRLPDVDMIMISLVEYEENVRELLSKKVSADIWTITELLQEAQKHYLDTGEVQCEKNEYCYDNR